MDIACIGTEEQKKSSLAGANLAFYASEQDFFAAAKKVKAIVLTIRDLEVARNMLIALRQHPDTTLLPVFTSEKNELSQLCDGAVTDYTNLQAEIDKIESALQDLKTWPEDGRGRFLAYLYSRPHAIIVPEKSWKNPFYYYFPLIELFSAEQEDWDFWLEELHQNKILEIEQLVDSLFLCPSCSAAHLKFTERCPHCKSLNIEATSFLHCFTCGMIAPEADFLKAGKLSCPKCHSLLRHVGDEYDRPLESGQCLSCHEYYLDAELSVSCMLCDSNFAPDHLAKRNIYSLHLNHEEGRERLYAQRFSESFTIFDHIHYIQPDYFYALLDWLLQIKQRYAAEVFSIMGIKLTPKNGGQEVLHRFADILHQTLRKTDMLTRLHNDELWIILPKTDQAGLATVKERIEAAEKDLKTYLDIQMTDASFDQPDAVGNDVEALLVKLRTQFA